jgi:hypothetical protein
MSSLPETIDKQDNTAANKIPFEQKENHPYGNTITSTKNPNNIRIFFKNINGVKPNYSWDKFHTACLEMKESSIDIAGMAETNLKWNSQTKTQI